MKDEASTVDQPWEIRDTSTGNLVAAHPDEAAARADLTARLRAARHRRLRLLEGLEVRRRAVTGNWITVGVGLELARWVAFGSASRASDTVTSTEPASAEQVALLAQMVKRSRGLAGLRSITTPMRAVMVVLAGVALVLTLISVVVALIFAAVALLAFISVVLSGQRHDAVIEADVRRGLLVV